jgi:chorismate mutase/prephenate dehydratase
MFKVPHHPGSLVDALDVFKNNKLNLTWIESFLARSESGKGEYIFFVDFEGHVEDPKVKRAIQGLEKHCEQLVVLGSFPIATVS